MRDEGYLLSRDGIEKIRADHRARRGRISSIDEMKRRRYDTLATVPDVNVSARLINGVVFTGQLITVGIVGQNFTEDLSSQVIGDVLNGSTGTVFYGKVATDVTTSDSSFCYVDVYYRQWFSTMAKLRPTTCRVLAYNDTGISLVNGQVVRLEHLAEHSPAMPFATSKNIGRWIVTDYRCAT